jgi:hypothetical protein
VYDQPVMSWRKPVQERHMSTQKLEACKQSSMAEYPPHACDRNLIFEKQRKATRGNCIHKSLGDDRNYELRCPVRPRQCCSAACLSGYSRANSFAVSTPRTQLMRFCRGHRTTVGIRGRFRLSFAEYARHSTRTTTLLYCHVV